MTSVDVWADKSGLAEVWGRPDKFGTVGWSKVSTIATSEEQQ